MSIDDGGAPAAFDRQRAAMAVTGVTGPEKAVLLVLAIMGNASGASWPPVSGPNGIAARASIGRRTAQEALRGLEAKGLVLREDRPGKGAVLTLAIDVRASRACAPAAHVRQPRGRCAPAAPKQPRTPIPQKASPSSEAIKPKRGVVATAIEALPELPPSVTAEQWNDFVVMRQAMQRGPKPRPWTVGAAKGIIRDLHRLVADSEDPGEALERSTANGWAGVRFNNGDQHANGRGAHWRRAGGAEHPGGREGAAAASVLRRLEGGSG